MPSSRKYFVVPAVVDGAGTKPDFAPDPDLTKLLYVVLLSGGTAHVPSLRRYLLAAPVDGAGTKPLVPVAEVVAPFILEYVVSLSVTLVTLPVELISVIFDPDLLNEYVTGSVEEVPGV